MPFLSSDLFAALALLFACSYSHPSSSYRGCGQVLWRGFRIMLKRVARAGRVAACPILLYTLDCPKLINWQALWCVFIPARSEERRVGKECISRWSASHSKNKDLR